MLTVCILGKKFLQTTFWNIFIIFPRKLRCWICPYMASFGQVYFSTCYVSNTAPAGWVSYFFSEKSYCSYFFALKYWTHLCLVALPTSTLLGDPFCVTWVAWQTHWDHVVRPRHRPALAALCCSHTFCFCSITFEGMYWFHSSFAQLYITIKYRSSSILIIIHQILAELWPFFDLVFVVRFHSSFCCSFPLSNFWRDALISFRLCKTLYHCKIQVKFNIGNHLPNFGWVMALFRLSFCCLFLLNNLWRDALISFKLCRPLCHSKIQVKFDIGNHLPNFSWVMALFRLSFCWCVDIGFRSITYRVALILLKFAEGYIIVKYRSSSILVIIRRILDKLWPIFPLVAFRDRSDYKDQCFFPFSYQMVGALSRRHIRVSEF